MLLYIYRCYYIYRDVIIYIEMLLYISLQMLLYIYRCYYIYRDVIIYIVILSNLSRVSMFHLLGLTFPNLVLLFHQYFPLMVLEWATPILQMPWITGKDRFGLVGVHRESYLFANFDTNCNQNGKALILRPSCWK